MRFFLSQKIGLLLPSVLWFFTVISFPVSASSPVPPITPLLESANIEAGKQAFQLCAGCHHSQAGAGQLVGPNLWNILGRDIASMQGFSYSENFAKIEGQWNNEVLNQLLYSPSEFASGTRMVIPGIKDAQQRANLIAYINILSDKPVLLAKAGKGSAPEGASSIDAFGDSWPQGDGRDVTGYTCSVCHSLAIVRQQGLNRDNWEELIEWMVEEQGMQELSDGKLQSVLDYLSLHFNEDRQR